MKRFELENNSIWIPCSSEPAALMAWLLPWHFRSGEKHSLSFWEHMDMAGLCQRQLLVLRPGLIASLSVSPVLPGWQDRKLMGFWAQCEEHYFCLHYSTLSSVTLFLLVKSCFPNHNKSKPLFLPLLFSFPVPFYSDGIQSHSQPRLLWNSCPYWLESQ